MSKYSLILADPPWFYAQRSAHKDTKFGGGASSNYPLMKDKELLALADQVKAVTDTNCALALWTTHPRMDFAMQLMKAWGFKYRTTLFTWVKIGSVSQQPIYGPGYYTASNPETVLLGVKGSVPIAAPMRPSVVLHEEDEIEFDADLSTTIFEPRGEHSRKPEYVREEIVRIFGDVPRLEMFCRFPKEGWDCTGDQVDGLDIRESLIRIASR